MTEITEEIEKFKVYELDFGDTNVLSEKIDDILQWIKGDMGDMKSHETLEYTISIKEMTRKEIEEIPDWA